MSETQSPRPGRGRLAAVAKIAGIAAVVILMALFIQFTIVFIGACLTPAPPPAFAQARTRLMSLANNLEPPSERAEARTPQALPQERDARPTDLATSAYEKLMAQRNAHATRQFGLIVDAALNYEKTSHTLTTGQQKKMLDAIESQCAELWGGDYFVLDNALKNPEEPPPMLPQKLEFLKWFDSARMENAKAREQWHQAAYYAAMLNYHLRAEWKLSRLRQNPREPVFESDYYRQVGLQDWKRVVYCYRSAHDLDGTLWVAMCVYELEKEKTADYLGRLAWKFRRHEP